jgi:hypothetical protein
LQRSPIIEAIWRVENGRLAECWVERSALELDNHLRGTRETGELTVF